MSVNVVKKMLLAVAGSAPNRLSTNGTATPKIPLPMQAPTMAMKKKWTEPARGPQGERNPRRDDTSR